MTGGVAIPLHLTVHVLGLTVALGLAAYAAARRRQASVGWGGLLLGGLLLAVSHAATGALLAGDALWPAYLRAAGYAAVAVGAAGRLVGPTLGVVALAPPTPDLAAAVAGAMAALATARGVLGRGRDVLPLAGGLLLWAVADLLTRPQPVAAAALSLAGSVAVGWWLLRRARQSLLARFVASFLVVLMILVVGVASASGFVFSLDLTHDQLSRLEDLAVAREQQVSEDWPTEMRRIAAPLTGSRLDQALTRTQEEGAAPGGLDQLASTVAAFPGVDLVVLVGREGQLLGSWSTGLAGPLAPADARTVAGDPMVAEALQGSEVAGLVPLGGGRLVATGLAPVAPRDDTGSPRLDRQSGALVVGRVVTDARLVDEIQGRTGADATVLVAGRAAASTLPDAQADAVAGLLAADETPRTIQVSGTERFMASAPIVDDAGDRLGTIVLTLDAGTLAGVQDASARTLFFVTVAGMLAAALLAWGASSRTTRPIRRLTDAAEAVAGGDLDVSVDVQRDDEVGRLGRSFNDMTASLAEREEDLRRAAATETALRSRLEIVTSSIGEALIAVDERGTITTANPAAAALLGTTSGRLPGRDVAAVLRGTDVTGTPLLAALGGPGHDGPAAVRATVGTGVQATPVSATAAPIRGPDGERHGRVYVLRDIRGEVEVERMKTEFLANISHELRTPLTPIKGYAEVLRAKDLGPERTADFASHISAAAARLERVIGMLVDFAALEAGRIEVSLQPTDLAEVVEEVVEEWREQQPDRTFVRRVAHDLEPVQADPALLRRVFAELVDNAVKFSDETVSILVGQEDEHTVRVTVRDRGQGISREELDTILRDFHQVDGSATRRIGGLGLGLSIVQRILFRFGADVEVASEPGRGTDVMVLLPTVDET